MFGRTKELEAAQRRIGELEASLMASVEQTRFFEAKADKALEELTELKIKNAVLTERLDLLTNYITPAGAPGSLNTVNEEAEDLKYAFDHGMLSKSDYEDALAAAGLSNTTIEVFS